MTTNFTIDKTADIGVGFRYSPYGQTYNPGAEYWARVGRELAIRFPTATPEVIWIVSTLEGQGTHLTFPWEAKEPCISYSNQDENQYVLDLFDHLGFRVWLQVEPGDASVETLIDLVLSQYGHHPCVAGMGVDVEWHHSSVDAEGLPVDDKEATIWLEKARAHGKHYRIFLKHWMVNKLPQQVREGIMFVDDSQMFESLDDMLAEFGEWGKHFSPAPVAFQIGYPADKKWWGRMDDPAKEIGDAILGSIPNAKGVYWVNFSVFEIFPP